MKIGKIKTFNNINENRCFLEYEEYKATHIDYSYMHFYIFGDEALTTDVYF